MGKLKIKIKKITTYGWQLTENHIRIALEDHGFPPLSVRQAIDASIRQEKKR